MPKNNLIYTEEAKKVKLVELKAGWINFIKAIELLFSPEKLTDVSEKLEELNLLRK